MMPPMPRKQWHFNPRPPWGGRRFSFSAFLLRRGISIHALRGEGDNGTYEKKPKSNISIHALRGEGDGKMTEWG